MDSEPIKIIGIDPGTTHIGFSVLEIDPFSLEIVRSFAYSFNAGTRYLQNLEIEDIHGSRLSRLFAIKAEFIDLLKRIKPFSVGCEAPFYFSRRPGAYAPLVEVIFILRLALIDYNPDKFLYTYDPSSVKNAVKAKGNADKDQMKKSIMALDDLKANKNDLQRLDEHAIDSLAVGYCHYQRTLLGLSHE